MACRRKTKLQPGETLLQVSIPFTSQHEFVAEYKQSHKREDCLAVGNAGFYAQLQSSDGESQLSADQNMCVLPLPYPS